MRSQHSIYAKIQNWLQTEDEPSDAQLAEIEKAYQDWIKQSNNSSPLPWDWELNLFKTEQQETEDEEDLYDLYYELHPDECYSDQETEDEEDLYDLY